MKVARSVMLGGMVLLGLLTAGVSADPSYFGYTGLIVVPTAETVGKELWNVAAYAKLHDISDTNQYSVNFGAVDGLEIGLDHTKTGTPIMTDTRVNLKYAMPKVKAEDASIAMGVIDATNENKTLVYGVASKNLIHRKAIESDADPRTLQALRHFRDISLDGHFGLIGGVDSNFFVGLELKLGKYVSVLGEHFNNSKNAGIRAHLTDKLTADFGLVHLDNTTHHRVGVSYNQRF
ncbi:MAG: hypothetical protein GW911_17090 [Armatimonadetes bacterium]|nr:hypothetical protein [Armatimonadota bacterium]NCO93108.1 hypothetical protein [Armatimonadota bacterium]NCP29694.1 hypothetical protein [Armatimonadota bacterium]NCQ31972.1 hypothetical protein [Armatimonadota bacterium]NDK13744.1 hypothetical protein [Armatimonadota bacterium]